MSPDLASAVSVAISAAEGPFVIRDVRPVAGGCIARNLCIGDGRRRYFVKVHTPDRNRLVAESIGLTAMARCAALRVPRVVAMGLADSVGFLVLEWLELEEAGADAAGDARLADAIADLHAIEYPRFGWEADNWIGATPQVNTWSDDWGDFFVSRRLQPQFTLARAGGYAVLDKDAERLYSVVRSGLNRRRSRASLLHGDLWSGNVGFVGGKPAVFDPAVYAGDGETDLAMAALFGGFSRRFFERYAAINSADEGADWRRAVYQLYHVLNHVNLFGTGYVAQAQVLIARVLAGP